ncbi:FBP domain-containing protein [Tersicoccus sp. MR15.9]|uniref:FBP domain-containing protein n=1 Tax=Tersicoccus mangrovi TaxID=3121635 RepID=UPI002FE4FC71
MQPLTLSQIRYSFINASRSESARLTPPPGFDRLDWDGLDVLGWRDPKMPLRGYLALRTTDGRLVSVLLRAPAGGARKNRAVLCELCRSVEATNDVLLWVARRAGASGRNGNTVGTLICADFACSANVRIAPPEGDMHPDPQLVVDRQIEGLIARADQFARRVSER